MCLSAYCTCARAGSALARGPHDAVHVHAGGGEHVGDGTALRDEAVQLVYAFGRLISAHVDSRRAPDPRQAGGDCTSACASARADASAGASRRVASRQTAALAADAARG